MIARPFVLLALVISALTAEAQLFSSSASVTISAGAELHVNGDLHNHGNGLLVNDGVMHVSGDLTHDAANTCFGTSAGTVVLDGGAQNIAGASNIIFNDLTLVGTGDKSLLRDVEVGGAYATPAGVLQLGDAHLLMNGNDLVIRNGAPAAVQRVNGYIVSETDPVTGYSFVRWNIGEAAVGTNYVIPFGNGTTNTYIPFTADISTSGTGSSGWIAMATYPTVPNATPNNRPLPTGLSTLIDFGGVENAPHVLDRWWVMENGNYAVAPAATLSHRYRDSEWNTGTNTIAEGALQLERLENGQWQMQPTILNTIANTLTSGAQPLEGSIWTAAESGSPLPVELLSFTGERVSEHEVELHWTTASEHNNAGFEVWRMAEGESDFREIGWVDGQGESQQLVHYPFTDAQASEKTSYYRLRQADNDGQYEWTPVVVVGPAEQGSDLVVYPNPCEDQLFLSNMGEGPERADVIDGIGRVVLTVPMAQRGELDVSSLVPGPYSLRLEGPAGVRSVRFVKR